MPNETIASSRSHKTQVWFVGWGSVRSQKRTEEETATITNSTHRLREEMLAWPAGGKKWSGRRRSVGRSTQLVMPIIVAPSPYMTCHATDMLSGPSSDPTPKHHSKVQCFSDTVTLSRSGKSDSISDEFTLV